MSRAQAWALALAGYALLVVVLTWPLALHLGEALPGTPNIDALDTVALRGQVARSLGDLGQWPRSDQVYWPTGYTLFFLTPNLLDHLLGAPFTALPFPLGDNLFWGLILVANGLAAHKLGLQVGGSHAAGALVGAAWLCSDAVLRELNLHHAPQLLMPWVPLYIGAMLRALDGERRQGLLAGLWMGLTCLSYWYNGLFLTAATVPLLLARLRDRSAARQLAWAIVVAAVVASPALWPFLSNWASLPLTDIQFAPPPLDMREALEPVPESLRFVVEQSADPLFAFQAQPMDRSNRLSLVLLGVAGWGLWRERRWEFLAIAAIGGVFILGPYLKIGEDPTDPLLSLPFRWLGASHPFFARLTWPSRWGWLLPLGLALLAVRTPRAWIAALLIPLEALLLSANAPTQIHPLDQLQAWSAVEYSRGVVLELPLARSGLHAPLPGLHARWHRKRVANPILLPPGALPPPDWNTWAHTDPVVSWLLAYDQRAEEGAPGPLSGLAEQGLGAIALDATPGSVLTSSRIRKYKRDLSEHFGAPEDYGAVIVWWVMEPAPHPAPAVDGAAWRKARQAELEESPRPELPMLMEPIYNAYRP